VGTHVSTLAIELPRSITPEMAGLTVGAFVGIVGFIAVWLLVGRKSRRPARRMRMAADHVVLIAPYGTMQQRETPMPMPVFQPSNALSARAFAKMGRADFEDSPSSEPIVSIDVDIDVDVCEEEVARGPSMPAVTVSPVVVLSSSADRSEPHPLGIIKTSSSAMQAAPIADLSFDDSPTEIGETYFDEPPQPRRRTDPPRIRKIDPARPRFTQPTRTS
jgi:hypothetical protein